MAWNIAGVVRQTRAAAAEAAHRAGVRLYDRLDAAIADDAGLGRAAHIGAEDDPFAALDAAAGRTGEDRSTNALAQAASASGRFQTPLSTRDRALRNEVFRAAEAEAARAFETVAELLERENAARDI